MVVFQRSGTTTPERFVRTEKFVGKSREKLKRSPVRSEGDLKFRP